MGRRGKGSILGHIVGKVSTVVLKDWKGVSVVQGVPVPRRNQRVKTEKESEQHDLFNLVGRFLGRALRAINLGYQQHKNAEMTPLNAATSYNMLHAVVGQYPDLQLDFKKVRFSNPIHKTENGWNIKLVGDEQTHPYLTWELNSFPERTTLRDDRLVVLCYYKLQNKVVPFITDTERHIGFFKLLVFRNPFESILLPDGTTVTREMPDLNEIHCWVYFISADRKRVSETEYLGQVFMKF
jgi:hypothetical protein